MAAEELHLERWRGREESYLVIKQTVYVNILYIRSDNTSFFIYQKTRVNDLALYPEAKMIKKIWTLLKLTFHVVSICICNDSVRFHKGHVQSYHCQAMINFYNSFGNSTKQNKNTLRQLKYCLNKY